MAGAAVIARGLLGEFGAGEQSSLLADCHESNTQPSRCRGTEKEAARLDASDLVGGARKGLGERVDDSIEEIGVVEHRPDIRVSVREGDAITDLGDQVKGRHSRTGAGKTTIAHRLADKSRLAVYRTDAAIRVHTERAGGCAAPLLESFRRMSIDERWLLRDPAEMYRTFPWFHGEGFNLLVEDLRSLPITGVVLVEGFRLLPHFVRPHLSDPNHAVWLIPTPEFRRAAFAARDRSEAF